MLIAANAIPALIESPVRGEGDARDRRLSAADETQRNQPVTLPHAERAPAARPAVENRRSLFPRFLPTTFVRLNK